MRYLIVLCLMVAVGGIAHSQLPDFPLHSNGLIYDDTLMRQLRHLADSIRARASFSSEAGAYFSPRQTTGSFVRLDTGDIDGAYDDLRKGISFDSFVRKYPQCEMNRKILILLDERPGYRVSGVATYYNINSDDWSDKRITLITDEQYRPVSNAQHKYAYYPAGDGIIGDCVYSLNRERHTSHGKSTDSPYVYAFFLDGVPKAARLPAAAARLLGYRDRIVDSATGVYDKDAKTAGPDLRGTEFGPAQEALDNYIGRKIDSAVAIYRRDHPYEYPNSPYREVGDWSFKRQYTDSLSTVDTCFKRLLATAIAEVHEKNYYPFIYLERYMDTCAPRAALDIRRRWIHAMTDPNPLLPRLYAMRIAGLAAKVGNWSVFIQAQLAVAVDPEGRYPDLRQSVLRTYFLRELEVLNIDIDDILLADVLASPWPDPTFVRARRLGRALALEGGDKNKLEKTVLRLVSDKGLNDYQRLAMHYLFLNYVDFLPVGRARDKALTALERADGTLPEYLSARVRVQKEALDDRRNLTVF
jgi:hypothetical protein